ncbi:tetratricopeptide repeat protein [Rugamonas sp.]|uniref:tetratricopeptide repeat protein n=1 Tax=Rugamonas sp. TaxID=1926287 RepID=UPI0025FE6F93|nr:tetratricopeptide repeat protein [Rugamonas sp.]
MTIFGVGLHVLVALFFAIHAIRNGQQMYWLMILFLFPGLGSIVYFFAIYLPGSKLQHGTRRAVTTAARSLDPGRELREARAAFDYTPTAQNQMRLAAAQLEAGAAADAAATYEASLQGVFASDLEIRYGAARANLACGRYAAAVAHLQTIRASDANFRAEPVALQLAQALAGAGRQDEAKVEFAATLARYGSFAARAEFAIWAATSGDIALAGELYPELQSTMSRWSRQTRDMNMALIRRLNAAMELARR